MPVAATSKLIGLQRQAQREGWAKWIRSTADEKALLKGCRFNERRARHVVEFFPRFLRHSKDRFADKPFELLEWQIEELICPIFGWEILDEFGQWVRRFKRAYVELPKKMGKSTLAAGIGTYMLVGDGEAGAEVYSASSNREQANIVHAEAVNMVLASPELLDALTVNKATKTIAYEETRSFWRVLASKPTTNEGWNAHCIIADELHQWRGAPGRDLYGALRYAIASRSQPLLFQITTAGNDPQSVCREQHEYAKGLLNGTIEDERYFALIKAAAPDDDPWDEATWRKANPSLGVTVSLQSFRDDANEAKQSPAAINKFKQLRLNQWTTGGGDPWLRITEWQACRAQWSPDDLIGQPCWGGLDLGQVRDTASLQLIFKCGDKYRLLSYFWLPEQTADEERSQVPWHAWDERGFITLTPGNVTDFAYIEQTIHDLAQQYAIQSIGFDSWQARQLVQRLQVRVMCESFGQTMPYMGAPTREFERLVVSGGIEHLGNACMDWQVGNAVVKPDVNGNIKPLKPNRKGDYRRIDGVVSAVMALAISMRDESLHAAQSYYSLPDEQRNVFAEDEHLLDYVG